MKNKETVLKECREYADLDSHENVWELKRHLAQKLTTQLVGLPLEDAREICNEFNLEHRVTSSDSRACMITMDCVFRRLNFKTVKEIVTFVDLG